MKKAINKQIAKLQQDVARMSVRTPGGGGRRRGGTVRAIAPTTTIVANVSKQTRRKRNVGNNQSLATVTLARSELLKVIKTTSVKTGASVIKIIPSNFNLLNNIAGSFENVVFNKMHFYWKPAVGTTTNGMVSYGIDYAFKATESKDRLWCSGLTPNFSHAIWCDTSGRPLVVPTKSLKTRLKYIIDAEKSDDATFGQLLIAWDAGVENTTLGEIWCDYNITLSGTRASN